MPGKFKAKYPNANNPFIKKAFDGNLKFKNVESLRNSIEKFFKNYTQFPKLNESEEEDVIYIWIWAFEQTEEEIRKGYEGNYAKLSIVKNKDKGQYVVRLEKVWKEKHPRKKRPLQKHPDWGDPIVRYLNKGLDFESFDEAREKLIELAKKYPGATILKPDRAFVNIYAKEHLEETGKPTKSYEFEIIEKPEGNFTISIKANTWVPTGSNVRVDDEFFSYFYLNFQGFVDLEENGTDEMPTGAQTP